MQFERNTILQECSDSPPTSHPAEATRQKPPGIKDLFSSISKENFSVRSINLGKATMDSMFEIGIVIDTNYLLSDLNFFKALFILLPDNLFFYIPYTVTKELDGLKQSKDNKISYQARQANDFIYSSLLNSPKIRGQQIGEVLQKGLEIPDDRILDCCLYAKEKLTPNIILLSHDKNLCMKALVHSVVTISKFNNSPQEFLKLLHSADYAAFFERPKHREFRTVGVVERGSFDHQRDIHVDGMMIDELTEPETDTDTEMDSSTPKSLLEILCTLETILTSCLGANSSIILENFYGREYEKTIIQKKPWTLTDIIEIIRTQKCIDVDRNFDWNYLKTIAGDLSRSVRNQEEKLTRGDVLKFINQSKGLLKICVVAGVQRDFKRADSLLKKVVRDLNMI
jgi:rRNA-processing protein FCF1